VAADLRGGLEAARSHRRGRAGRGQRGDRGACGPAYRLRPGGVDGDLHLHLRVPGGEQLFNVPASVSSVTITAIGGPGGSDAPYFVGGEGGLESATVPVMPSTTLYVEVGGPGANVSLTTDTPGQTGGFNGGGAGSAGYSGLYASASGGGASDVRTSPSADPGSLATTRLIVAAGSAGTFVDMCSLVPSSPGGGATVIFGGSAGAAPATAGVRGLGGIGGPAQSPATAAGVGDAHPAAPARHACLPDRGRRADPGRPWLRSFLDGQAGGNPFPRIRRLKLRSAATCLAGGGGPGLVQMTLPAACSG
jgi:Glycine rich protein